MSGLRVDSCVCWPEPCIHLPFRPEGADLPDEVPC